MASNYQERIARDVRQQQERTSRDVRQQQERTSTDIRQELERIARDVRQQQERTSRDVRQQQERTSRDVRQQQERTSTDVRQELEHIARDARQQQERIARETRQEQDRIARETRQERERDSIMSTSISLSPGRFEKSYEKPAVTKRNGRDLPIIPLYELDEIDNDQSSDTSDTSDTYRSSISNCCSYPSLAHEFISSLHWPDAIFNSRFDRCYCPSCYKSHWKDVLQAGGASYVIPRGWIRLGVRIDPVIERLHAIWDHWPVTYHGTSKEAALSILKHRQFSIPGDQLLNGSFLGIRPGHIPEKRYIYTSPTIAYSSLPVYCPSYSFTSHKNEHFYVKMVLECRQDPELMHVQGETVGSKRQRICPYIPNNQIEYYTEARASLVAYGLLLCFEKYS
jgi:hypothetical protein